jgi:hypothetical protein
VKNPTYAWIIMACAATAAAPAVAQPVGPRGTEPPYGYGAGSPPFEEGLPPYEILASVRSAGFHPLSRPVRRGPVYVLFAADRYLVDVRVTVDARTGRVMSATRLAGALSGGPGYDGHDVMPRSQTLGYPPVAEHPPRGYERAPVPPANVPNVGDAPPLADARRAPSARAPLPRSRPGDVVTGSVKDGGTEPPSAAPSPAPPGNATVTATPPQQPTMVPIAPLE